MQALTRASERHGVLPSLVFIRVSERTRLSDTFTTLSEENEEYFWTSVAAAGYREKVNDRTQLKERRVTTFFSLLKNLFFSWKQTTEIFYFENHS